MADKPTIVQIVESAFNILQLQLKIESCDPDFWYSQRRDTCHPSISTHWLIAKTNVHNPNVFPQDDSMFSHYVLEEGFVCNKLWNSG